MTIAIEERVCHEARQFAQLPFCKTWRVVKAHLRLLAGVGSIEFTASDAEGERSFLIFNYGGEEFCIHDHHAYLCFSVSSRACSELILHDVLRHFSELLSAHLRD